MEGYYDTSVVQRRDRELQLTTVIEQRRSVSKSLLADGVELIEMPLRYDKYNT